MRGTSSEYDKVTDYYITEALPRVRVNGSYRWAGTSMNVGGSWKPARFTYAKANNVWEIVQMYTAIEIHYFSGFGSYHSSSSGIFSGDGAQTKRGYVGVRFDWPSGKLYFTKTRDSDVALVHTTGKNLAAESYWCALGGSNI